MNGGNPKRGQADGFDIDILPKLKDCKSSDNTTNLLKYIVQFCIEKFDFVDDKMPFPEPCDIKKYEYLNFEVGEAKYQDFEDELEHFKNRADHVIDYGDPNYLEPFQQNMNKFFNEASDHMKKLQDLIDDCSRTYISTKKYFRYKERKSKDVPPKNPFFYAWSQFCQDFKEIWDQENKKEPSWKNRGFRVMF